MLNEKKPLTWMILFGLIRHGLVIVGMWMQSHGLIDADTHERLVSEGAVQVVSWVLILVPILWSSLQKMQVWGWVKTALHLDPRRAAPGDVPVQAPGPSLPV